MPALTLCATPGCNTLVCNGHCATHRRERNQQRGTRQARGYGAEHDRARSELLADNPLCHWGCGRPATTADHIPPLRTAATPADWRGVLVPSCVACQNRQVPERDHAEWSA